MTSRIHDPQTDEAARPDWWRLAVVALCTLILCSCRSPASGRISAMPHAAQRMPAEAYTGAPTATANAGYAAQTIEPCPTERPNTPVAYTPQGPWAPSGLRQPWPQDEYVRDGGDEGVPTGVNRSGEVQGLGMEDTVAHFDTLDGRTLVEPSNPVYLYSPRFGAVRQVVGLVAAEERQRAGGVCSPQKLGTPTMLQIVANAKQNLQPGQETAARPPVGLRSKQGGDVLSTLLAPKGFQDSFKSYENLSIIRQGISERTEMPLLARGATAALAWSHTQAVQILLDRKSAAAEVRYEQAESVYTVSSPPGCPRLRLVKVASTPFAKPGEEVDFTLRFDNIGNQPIGNVAILDSLNTRLEYVAGSAQCSRDAKFSTAPNEGDSETVRCELSKPLEPGQGGVFRFRCRVR